MWSVFKTYFKKYTNCHVFSLNLVNKFFTRWFYTCRSLFSLIFHFCGLLNMDSYIPFLFSVPKKLFLHVRGFCIGLTTLSCKKLLLRKQQRVTYKNHLCRTSLRNPCHGQQWMPRVKTPETLQVIGFEWLTVAKAERKPLSWQREPSAQKQPHWLAFGMCEQCMSEVGWRKSLLKWSVTNLIS